MDLKTIDPKAIFNFLKIRETLEPRLEEKENFD